MGDKVGQEQVPATGSAPVPACVRCRSFKKKCSRTFPACALCATGGHQCSYSQLPDTRAQNRQLKARVDWLSRYISKYSPPEGFGGKRKIDEVETDTDLDGLAATRGPRRKSRSGDHYAPSTAPDIHHQYLPTGQHDPGLGTPLSIDNHNIPAQLDFEKTGVVGLHLPIITSCDSGDPTNVGPNSVVGDKEKDDSSNRPASGELGPTAGKLVDAYFCHVGSSYPCVDRARVRAILNAEPDPFRIRPNDREWTIVYLVMAIGNTTLQRINQVPSHTPNKFKVPYADALHDCLLNPNLTSVLILVLLSIYSMWDSEYPSTWTLACIASRQAIDIGLTRRSPDWKMGGTIESEKRHRIFWSVFILDRRMSSSLGVHPMIAEENADIPLPGLTVDEFISSERSRSASSLQISRQAIQLSQLEEKILWSTHLQRPTTLASMSAETRRIIIKGIRLDIENWYSHWCLLTPYEADNMSVQRSVTWISARYYHLLMILYYPTHFNLCSERTFDSFEIVEFAMKYVQSVTMLMQQRQLPLNRLTLCRLLPAGLMLVYGFVDVASYPAKDDVASLIAILNAYTKDWDYAHAAAHIFRGFYMSLVEPTRIVLTRPWDSSHDYHRKSRAHVKQHCIDLLRLLQELVGTSSSFCWGLAEQMQIEETRRPVSIGGGLLGACHAGDIFESRDSEVSNGLERSELDLHHLR